jgi:hypothetical protein
MGFGKSLSSLGYRGPNAGILFDLPCDARERSRVFRAAPRNPRRPDGTHAETPGGRKLCDVPRGRSAAVGLGSEHRGKPSTTETTGDASLEPRHVYLP